MRILIAGAGRAGLSVAGYLTTAGHLVTVIDRDPLVCARALAASGIVALAGDAAALDDAALRVAIAAFLDDADGLRRLSRASAGLCDGLGAGRVAAELLGE